MLAILPRTIVYGIKYKRLREYLAKHYYIKALVDLPNGAFENKDISTTAIILENNKNAEGAMSYIVTEDDGWKIRAFAPVDKTRLMSGDWGGNAILEKRTDVFRGKIGSNMFDKNGTRPVIHCSSVLVENSWIPSIKKTKVCYPEKIAQNGDVIINRVGRHAGYWTINTFGKSEVSDCIIVIQKPSKRILEIIENHSVNNRLELPLYGVTTKYILQSDVCRLIRQEYPKSKGMRICV